MVDARGLLCPMPVVMVQKEVADRLKAAQGTEDYGALSIEVQYLYDVKTKMDVSRKVFYPQPNVDSAIISFRPIREKDKAFEEGFFTLVKNSFRMRRKTLYNNLKDLYDKKQVEKMYLKLNLDSNIRAQQIDLDKFIGIYKELET